MNRKPKNQFQSANQAATKHGAYGLQKRVETGLTTKDDYKRYVALLDRWGFTPADVEAMGMLGSAIENRAWLHLISKDATGAYSFVKENSDDLELIIRLSRNASYQIDKADRGLLELARVLQKDDGAIIDAIASAKGNNGDNPHTD